MEQMKTRKPGSDKVLCVLCQKEIPVGEPYHWVRSRSAGFRPICIRCAVAEGLAKEGSAS